MLKLIPTSHWQEQWFIDLPVEYKLLWQYLLEQCDENGIWTSNLEEAAEVIDVHLDCTLARNLFSEKIIFHDQSGKWEIKNYSNL